MVSCVLRLFYLFYRLMAQFTVYLAGEETYKLQHGSSASGPQEGKSRISHIPTQRPIGSVQNGAGPPSHENGLANLIDEVFF